MIRKVFHSVFFALLAVSVLGVVFEVRAAEPVNVGAKLTPKLKELVQQEMHAVFAASQEILEALVSGDNATVADRARKIRDSFIMKSSLTPQDKKDLMAAVPPRFIEMDGHFHATSGKLAAAAESGDVELMQFYFGRMLQACAACHSRFAQDRFPGFTGGQAAGAHHHH